MAFMINYADDWRNGYIDLCQRVLKDGTVKDSRVGEVSEIRDYMFTLSPDALDLPLGTGRSAHGALAAAEAIQLCGGYGIPALTEAVSSKIASFVRDPDGTVHGNYGARVGMQIVDICEKLTADPNTRQAVVQIWHKEEDSRHRVPMPKDIPCTLTITFGTDDGRLTMSVVMRSNDVWLGVPYDVFQFRQLQRTVANCLGREIGDYCHHSVSMHAYDRNTANIKSLAFDEEFPADAKLAATGLHANQAADLMSCMFRILTGTPQKIESNDWYQSMLQEAYATLG
jgi:thymidylate synthase